jgi:hypothetical protein
MDEPAVASLRSWREGVNRGRWWGEGGYPPPCPPGGSTSSGSACRRPGRPRWRAGAGLRQLQPLFLDILVELHPATRFVYTRRNAVSWADSFLIMVLRHGTYRRGRP